MNPENKISISVIKNKSGRRDINIAQWFQFFKVHNFFANKTIRQIEYYLRNYRICVSYRGREVTENLNELYQILIQKIDQSRLPQLNRLQIDFELTKEDINSWLTGTPFKFDEDIYELLDEKELDYKIRPRFVDEDFQSRHANLKFKMNGDSRLE